ncbi:MAG: restriction endonuclease [Verrucomicrobiota bacterium]
MPIPDFQSIMLPLLQIAADGEDHRLRDAVEALANQFQLTSAERQQMQPNGSQLLFSNRVAWASTYLRQAGVLEAPRRGVFHITQRGREILAKSPDRIDSHFLMRFPEFVEFKQRGQVGEQNNQAEISVVRTEQGTPEDMLGSAYVRLRAELESQLLEEVKKCPPSFFESLVVDLLVRMGYGGSREDAGRAIGGTGDGGIDGIINEDRLGLDVIFIQAKRWDANVGRPEIQRFAGALQGRRARKGIFITTSSFTSDAKEYAGMIDTHIILIDGQRLANLMFEHSVGVSTIGRYELKRLDLDYFAEE